MNRKAALPGAAELFRNTGGSAPVRASTEDVADPVEQDDAQGPAAGAMGPDGVDEKQHTVGDPSARSSGERKHDSKITVYLPGTQVLEMEQARLELRGTHGIAVDRGRIVREAVSVILDDLAEQGEESVLVRRLRGVDHSPRENT